MTDKYIKHVVLLTSSGAQVTWTDFSYSFLGIKLTCDIRAGEEAIVCHHLAREQLISHLVFCARLQWSIAGVFIWTTHCAGISQLNLYRGVSGLPFPSFLCVLIVTIYSHTTKLLAGHPILTCSHRISLLDQFTNMHACDSCKSHFSVLTHHFKGSQAVFPSNLYTPFRMGSFSNSPRPFPFSSNSPLSKAPYLRLGMASLLQTLKLDLKGLLLIST